MSRETPKVPTIRPAVSRNGILVVMFQVGGRSGQYSSSSRFTVGVSETMIARSTAAVTLACSAVKKSASDLPTACAGSLRP